MTFVVDVVRLILQLCCPENKFRQNYIDYLAVDSVGYSAVLLALTHVFQGTAKLAVLFALTIFLSDTTPGTYSDFIAHNDSFSWRMMEMLRPKMQRRFTCIADLLLWDASESFHIFAQSGQ